ncbi:MAG TPA: ABC transporter ATP-binding protein, partial [Clostridia bacterium]
SEGFIQEALSNLMENRTVIVVSHRIATVENADHIFVISEGRVAENGTHKDLSVKSELYRRFLHIARQGV